MRRAQSYYAMCRMWVAEWVALSTVLDQWPKRNPLNTLGVI
jgi:hypothetical protein